MGEVAASVCLVVLIHEPHMQPVTRTALPRRNPALRTLLTGVGLTLVIVSPAVGIIPGPGGIPVFAAGLALMLRNSDRAKRVFVRAKRRWPRIGHYADLGLRRGSARRRRARDKALKVGREASSAAN